MRRWRVSPPIRIAKWYCSSCVTREAYVALFCDSDDSVARAACFRRHLPWSIRRALYKLPKSPVEVAAAIKDWTPPPPKRPAPPPGPPELHAPKRKYWREHL